MGVRPLLCLRGPSQIEDTAIALGADVLTDGRKFKNIDEYKKLLVANPDVLAHNLAEKLLTYATGGAPSRSDVADIDAIVRANREKKYGFRSLIHEIVQSRLFQSK